MTDSIRDLDERAIRWYITGIEKIRHYLLDLNSAALSAGQDEVVDSTYLSDNYNTTPYYSNTDYNMESELPFASAVYYNDRYGSLVGIDPGQLLQTLMNRESNLNLMVLEANKII